MKAKWKFPLTFGGNFSGLNDTGITQFKSIPIQHMTKETLQDSLDAKAYKDKPAIVKYSVFSISRDTLPDVDGLTTVFKRGSDYWSHHKDTSDFFKKGMEVLKREDIQVMAIQDYNTTGLSNIGGADGRRNSGGWMALVRSTGVTEKGPTDSGSFGIGKHAPFATSQIQTVMYGTVNEKDKFGFQGVTKIASFEDEDGQETQGTGYYGYPIDNDFMPITEQEEIPEVFSRYERGTDKFIIGFTEYTNWKFEVLKEAVASFMLAIHEGNLEVHIDDFILNKKSLQDAINEIKDQEPDNISIQFYQALTHANSKFIKKEFETEDGELEDIHLYLLAQEEFRKRISLYRSTGMEIYNRGHFRTPVAFAGVLIVKGKKLNAVLRKMEPPTHDKWDPNLYKENIRYAKKLEKAIRDWMNKETRNLLDISNIESIELKGFEKLLPDITEKESPIVDLDRKTLNRKTKRVKKQKKRKPTSTVKGLDGSDGGDGIISQPPEKKGKSKGRKKKSSGGTRRARISRARAFCLDEQKGVYNIRFWPETNGKRIFSLKSVGENNKKLGLQVLEAFNVNTKEILPIEDNKIGPLIFEKGKVMEIQVTFDSRSKFALEVKAL